MIAQPRASVNPPMPDLTRAEPLFSHLYRGGAWAHLWTDKFNRSLWFPVGTLPAVPASWDGHNVYFSVHPCAQIPPTNSKGKPKSSEHVRVQLAHVAAVNCLFSEYDAKDWAGGKNAILAVLETLEPYPSVIIDSGGGYHCYWLLNEPVSVTPANRDHLASIQATWVEFVGGDGGAKDLARVLRVPGTLNVKPAYGPDFPTVTIVEEDYDQVYDLSVFETLTEALRTAKSQNQQSPNKLQNQDGVSPMVTAALSILHRATPGNRNDALNRAAYTLGGLVTVGMVGESWATDQLIDAARRLDLPDGEAARTIQSGLAAGKVKPGDIRSQTSSQTSQSITAPVPAGYPTAAPSTSQPAQDAAPSPDYLLTLDADQEGHAQAVFRNTDGRYMHTMAFGWLHWTGTHWDMAGAEYRLDRAIVATLQERRHVAIDAQMETLIRAAKPSQANVRGTRSLLQSIQWGKASEFDTASHLLNTPSGVVDLRTGASVTHERSQRFTYCTPISYQPMADQGPWLRFLNATVGHYAELADWLQLAVGYSITGVTVEDTFFYLFGPPRSGKGLFTTALHGMLGGDLARGTTFNTFIRPRGGDDQGFDLAPLHRCRIVTASESGRYDKMNESAVKTMTGGDPLTAAYKGRDQFSFVPRWKVWVSSNHPLRGDADDDAFWGRARVIEFPHSHLGSEDKSMREALSSPQILAGALAWAVEGAKRWYASMPHGLKTPGMVATLTQAQRDALDTVGKWLGECCDVSDPTAFTANALLYASYKNWCEENGATPKHLTQWSQTLAKKGLAEAQRRLGSYPQRGRIGVSVAN